MNVEFLVDIDPHLGLVHQSVSWDNALGWRVMIYISPNTVFFCSSGPNTQLWSKSWEWKGLAETKIWIDREEISGQG